MSVELEVAIWFLQPLRGGFLQQIPQSQILFLQPFFFIVFTRSMESHLAPKSIIESLHLQHSSLVVTNSKGMVITILFSLLVQDFRDHKGPDCLGHIKTSQALGPLRFDRSRIESV